MTRWGSDDSSYWDMDDDAVRCETMDCEGIVHHPDLDRYCADCYERIERKREEFDRLFEKAVRREHAKGAAT